MADSDVQVEIDDLRYPIGEFRPAAAFTPDARHDAISVTTTSRT